MSLPPQKKDFKDDRAGQTISRAVLESKTYNYLVPGTMPVLEFDITPRRDDVDKNSKQSQAGQRLRLEIYNPLAGEVFEAKFPKGRIEVDNDGSITYFTTSSESVNLSVFLGRNLILTLRKDGSVSIKTPSRISDIQRDTRSSHANAAETGTEGNAQYDYIHFKLE